MKVCIGGTFDVLHKGHKLLISKALQTAGKHGLVFIGITTGKIIKEKKDIKAFEHRKKAVTQYLHRKKFSKNVIIKPIEDKYGPSINGDFDVIVVSPETLKTALEINKKRIQNGRDPLEIIQIPLVLAEDDFPISSSRVKKKEIDENGRVLKGRGD